MLTRKGINTVGVRIIIRAGYKSKWSSKKPLIKDLSFF